MIIKVKVRSNSGKQEVEKINEGGYRVSLKSFPEDNNANLELIKLLSKELKVPSKNINIIKGLKSRNKIIEIKT